MPYSLKISSFLLTFVALCAQSCVHNTHTSKMEDFVPATDLQTTVVNPDEGVFEKCSLTTRGVLITHCGSCHQSSLETHKPGAIAIFDLDKGANWHTSLHSEHLEGISNRILNKSSITEEQKEDITRFLEIKEELLKK